MKKLINFLFNRKQTEKLNAKMFSKNICESQGKELMIWYYALLPNGEVVAIVHTVDEVLNKSVRFQIYESCYDNFINKTEITKKEFNKVYKQALEYYANLEI